MYGKEVIKMRLENDLKPHNKETYVKLKEILITNNMTCIIQPTGSGKSFLILKLIEDYSRHNRDIIVIEPQKYIFKHLQKKSKQKSRLPLIRLPIAVDMIMQKILQG